MKFFNNSKREFLLIGVLAGIIIAILSAIAGATFAYLQA